MYILKQFFNTVVFLLLLLIMACNQNGEIKMKVEREVFGVLENGSEAAIYTLRNSSGAEVKITEFGAAVVSVNVPDNKGVFEDVVLGFDTLEEYVRIRGFYGAIVGRYGNRIDKGKFTLDGSEYQLPVNDGQNSLHGGLKGFDRVV